MPVVYRSKRLGYTRVQGRAAFRSISSRCCPELSYTDFEPTQTTLHLFAQVVGKIQLRYTRHRNHWWNMTFVPSARGLATRRMRYEETLFDAAFDFIDHQLVIRSNRAHAPAVLSCATD